MLDWFRQDGAEPHRNHSASHLPTRLHLAKAGLGVALVSQSAAERDLEAGNLVRIETTQPTPSLSYSLACATSPPSLPMRIVIDAAANFIAQKGDLNMHYAAACQQVPVSKENVIDEFDPAFAIKFTIAREGASGSLGDGDLFGSQHYAPLIDIPIPEPVAG
jgi:hypothetical protein